MNVNLPSGTVTFLFTDIEGSTPLWEQDPQAMRTALEQHHAILHLAILENDGHVFQIAGDAFCAAFAFPTQAIKAAVAAQRKLAEAEWGEIGPLRVRMGIHTGLSEFGDGAYRSNHTFNRVARIMAAGHGGQVIVSMEAVELSRRHLPEGIRLRDLGEHVMKGMSQPEHLFQVLAPGLRLEFPPLSTMSAPRHNLPVNLTPFIGREQEIAQVKELLRESRLVTLTGPGGVGKTRLCLKVAEDLISGFPHGVWVIELSQLSDPRLVPYTIASVLGLREDPSRPLVDLMKDYLGSKRLLLYLDNCEHLLEICAQLVREIINANTEVQILASSREALGISGEIPFLVPSLRVPDPDRFLNPSNLETYEAIQLFIKRASLVQPSFSFNSQNSAAVAQICVRLDGIPLAIELAAARIKALSPVQIAARLDDRFRLLTGGSRSAIPRQQTLKALIDWSYQLLSERERILFRRLSAFIGGWTLEAAEAVCAGEDIQMYEVLDLLARLIEKSLIIKGEEFAEARFRRLETIRQYARDKLQESGEEAAVRDRHKQWFLQFTEAAFGHLGGSGELTWLDKLEADHDNLRAALEWSLISHDIETAARFGYALVPFWDTRGHVTEARHWLRAVLNSDDPLSNNIRARILYRAGMLAERQGDYDEAITYLRESRSVYKELADQEGLTRSITGLGYVMLFSGDFENSIPVIEEALALAKQINHKGLIEAILDVLSMADALQGDYESARERLEGQLTYYRSQNDEGGIGWALLWLGFCILSMGDYLRADQLFREGLVVNHHLGNRLMVSLCQIGLVGISLERGETVRAAKLLGSSDALRRSIGSYTSPRVRQVTNLDDYLYRTREQLGETVFTAAWEEGRAIASEGLDAIVEYTQKDQ